jgi:crotonobetainyl-CoA:carnitine CoA-transferase CaiB-like acyl-CoA transferase
VSNIVDLTGLAGVYATRLLVEAGHDVVRVEARDGDVIRRLAPHLPAPPLETSACHAFYNAGKRSLALDLERPSARDALLRLCARADAVVASATAPLDETALRAANPRVVHTRIADEPELIAYAHSGLLSITGHPGEEPMILGGHIASAATGLYAAIATSAALYAARLSGQGQSVTVSVPECLESWMEQPMVTYLTTGTVTERRGFRGAITAVSGAFRCEQGYWMVSVPHGPDGWARFIGWIKDPVLAADSTLADERARLRRRDAVLDRISEWSKTRDRDQIVAEAQRERVPASPVATPLDLVDDPQLVARGFQKPIAHPLFGDLMFPQGAIGTLSGVSIGPAPRLGQHSDQILASLGYSNEEQRDILA